MSLYDYLYRFAVYPLVERRSGNSVLAAFSKLESELGSPEKLLALQHQKLRNILEHAYAESPYWCQSFKQVGIVPSQIESVDDLRKLPVLEKRTVREQLEDISPARFQNERITATTGGSTASPMKFYRDRNCQSFREALRMHYWKATGKGIFDRWANIWGAMVDLGNHWSWKNQLRSQYLERVINIPSNLIDDESVKAYANDLTRFQPKMIHGYSQAVYLFAKLLQEHGLSFPKTVTSITTTAEPLYDYQKSFLEEFSGLPVFTAYGTREFGYIGGEYPGQDGLVINPLNTIIEIVDNEGQPVSDGQRGQILVTDLINYATPLIRYQIGDTGSWRNKHLDQNRWQAINIDAGRETDFVVSEKGRMVGGASLTLISAKGVNQLQFIQEKRGHLIVRFVPNAHFSSQDVDDLETQIIGIVGNLALQFEKCDAIEPTRSGKFRYVHSLVSREILSA